MSFFLPTALLQDFPLNRALVGMLLLLLLLLLLVLLRQLPLLLLDLITAGGSSMWLTRCLGLALFLSMDTLPWHVREHAVVLNSDFIMHVVVTWAWQDASPCRTVKNLLNLEDDSCPMGIKICKAVDMIYEHLQNPESWQSPHRSVFENRDGRLS